MSLKVQLGKDTMVKSAQKQKNTTEKDGYIKEEDGNVDEDGAKRDNVKKEDTSSITQQDSRKKEDEHQDRHSIISAEDKSVHQYIMAKTAAFFVSTICLGLFNGITGVTQLDLRDGLGEDVTMEDLSLAQSMKSIGMMVGGILGGMAVDRWLDHTDIMMFGACAIAAVAVFFKPITQHLWVLALLSFLDGVGHVIINIICSSMLLMMWGNKGDAPMQVIHLGFGIGWALAPLLGMPFISPDEDDNSTCNGNDTTCGESRIVIPYTIISVLTFLAGCIFIVFYVMPTPKGLKLFSLPKSSWKDVCSPGTCAGGHTTFAIAFITILTFFYFFIVAKDVAVSTYIFSYAVEGDLGFSKDEAAWLDFASKVCFVAGRAVAIPIAMVVAVQPMLFGEVGISALMAVGLGTLGLQHKTWLWIFTCLYQFFAAPIWPSGYSWADKYIVVYAIVLAIIELGCGVAGFGITWLTGYLYTYVSPESSMYLTVLFSLVLFLWLIFGQIVASKHGNRFSQAGEGIGDTEFEIGIENLALDVADISETTYL